MIVIRPRRSALFMPGSNARALEKARGLPADVVISISRTRLRPMPRPRLATRAALRSRGRATAPARWSIASMHWTPSGAKHDLEAAVNAAPTRSSMPKVSSLGILQTLGAKMRQLKAPEQIRVWAMIETASAILDIRAIADGGPPSRDAP